MTTDSITNTQLKTAISERHSLNNNNFDFKDLFSSTVDFQYHNGQIERGYNTSLNYNNITIDLPDMLYENNTSFVLNDYYKSINNKIQAIGFNHFISEISLKSSDIERWLKITSIISKISSLQKKGNIENTLDYIFDTIDDMVIDKQFELINNLLDIIEIEDLTIDTMVGLLTITSNWRNELSSRKSFYQRAYKFVNELYLTEETNQILGGLE